MANKVKVYNMKAEEVGTKTLKDDVFGVEYNEPLIHEMIVAYNANQRAHSQEVKLEGMLLSLTDKKEQVEQDKVLQKDHILQVVELFLLQSQETFQRKSTNKPKELHFFQHLVKNLLRKKSQFLTNLKLLLQKQKMLKIS